MARSPVHSALQTWAVLLVLVLALCFGGAMAGKACKECDSCRRKRCRFDDRCFYDKIKRSCQDSGADVCRVIQTNHGRKASAEVGGRGSKKVRCHATSVAPNNPCICVKKNSEPTKKKCPWCTPEKPLVPTMSPM